MDKFAVILILIFTLIGIRDVILSIADYFSRPSKRADKKEVLFLHSGETDVEFKLRSCLSEADNDVLVVNCGVDEEAEKILMLISRDSSRLKVMTAKEYIDYIYNGEQKKEQEKQA